MTEALVVFHGDVRARPARGPYGLVLTGMTADDPQDFTTLEFAAPVAAPLPEALHDVRVESLGDGHYRVLSGTREWQVQARAAHLHRDAARQFYAALPPRPVPAGRRFFWRAVLALAGSRAGLSILRSLRR